ncbi:MAG: hypothetical protein WBI91_09340 [Coriobacteriia bacterium]
MGFFDNPEEMVRRQGEEIDNLDRLNEALEAEMVEMAREFAKSMEALGVPADGRGLWAAGRKPGERCYVDRYGRHFQQGMSSGVEIGELKQVHYYRPGMRVDLTYTRDRVKERFRSILKEAARDRALQEREEG